MSPTCRPQLYDGNSSPLAHPVSQLVPTQPGHGPPPASEGDGYEEVDDVYFYKSKGEGLHLNPAYGFGEAATPSYSAAQQSQDNMLGRAGSNQLDGGYARPTAGAAAAAWIGRSSALGVRDNPAYSQTHNATNAARPPPRASSIGLVKNPVYAGHGVARTPVDDAGRQLPQAIGNAGRSGPLPPGDASSPGHGLAQRRDGQALSQQNDPAYVGLDNVPGASQT